MYCKHCGAELPQGKKFCPRCGREITKTAIKGETEPRVTAEVKDEQPSAEHDSPMEPVLQMAAEGVFGAEGTRKKKKRPSVKVAVAGAVLLGAIICVALYQINVAPASTAANSVAHESTKMIKTLPDANITLYGSDGKPMKDYDVVVTTDDGISATHHVDGEAFSPQDVGIISGTASIKVMDSTTDESHSIDVSIDKSGESSVEIKTEDYAGTDLAGSSVSSKNDKKQNSSSKKKAKDKKAEGAYGLYYEKVQELEKKYGQGEYRILSSGEDETGEYELGALYGLGFIKLVDLDGDGTEELITAHQMDEDRIPERYGSVSDSAYYFKTVEVWTVEKGRLVQVADMDAIPASSDGSFELYIAKHDDSGMDKTLILSSIAAAEDSSFAEYLVYKDPSTDVLAEKLFCLANEGSVASSSGTRYFIDGNEVEWEEWKAEKTKAAGSYADYHGEGDAYVFGGPYYTDDPAKPDCVATFHYGKEVLDLSKKEETKLQKLAAGKNSKVNSSDGQTKKSSDKGKGASGINAAPKTNEAGSM